MRLFCGILLGWCDFVIFTMFSLVHLFAYSMCFRKVMVLYWCERWSWSWFQYLASYLSGFSVVNPAVTAITFWLVTLPVTEHCPLAYCVVTQSLCVIVEWPGLQPMPNYHITPFCQDVFYCYLIFIIVVDCENRTCSISCLEVVTGILNHSLIFFVLWQIFNVCAFYVQGMCYVLFCFFVFGCQYQCS